MQKFLVFILRSTLDYINISLHALLTTVMDAIVILDLVIVRQHCTVQTCIRRKKRIYIYYIYTYIYIYTYDHFLVNIEVKWEWFWDKFIDRNALLLLERLASALTSYIVQCLDKRWSEWLIGVAFNVGYRKYVCSFSMRHISRAKCNSVNK